MNLFWDDSGYSTEFDFEDSKTKLIENLDYLHSMSVQEHTLYKKWVELQNPSILKSKPFISTLYDTQWKPTDIYNKELTIEEINNIQPVVDIMSSDSDVMKWTHIRRMISSMDFSANPGRNIKILVRDEVSNKVLGVVSLGSDVTSVGVRDRYIGWNDTDKYENGKLNNTTIGTSIIATQPLGYNFLGGKLVSMMTTVPVLREYWKNRYDDILVGVHTTSLYGVHSQYNGIPHFKTLGETTGKISIKPDDSVYEPWHHHIKKTYPEWYSENIDSGKSSPKQRILKKIFKECGISGTKYHHGYKRGVYFAQMYENGNEFLRSEIDESELVMKKKFEEGVDYISKWWKNKAIKRYTKLHEQNKLKPEHLFYIDGIGVSWDEFKQQRLNEVGR